MHIVNDSDLKSGGIGSDQISAIEEKLDEKDVDKIIVFGKKFTKSARDELNEVGIEFFSSEGSIISSQNPEKLYIRTQNMMNNICKIQCGKIPQNESECKGYSKHEIMCKKCEGEGKLPVPRVKKGKWSKERERTKSGRWRKKRSDADQPKKRKRSARKYALAIIGLIALAFIVIYFFFPQLLGLA